MAMKQDLDVAGAKSIESMEDEVEGFVRNQISYLRKESAAGNKMKGPKHIFKAKVLSSTLDEDLGRLVDFEVISSNSKPKKGARLVLWTNQTQSHRGIIYKASRCGFTLASTDTQTLSKGSTAHYYITPTNSLTAQKAMCEILNSSIYKSGEPAQRVRDVLLGRVEPTLRATPEPMEFFNKCLNESQRASIAGCMAQTELAVLHGPPGTGKSTTLVEIIRQALFTGGKALICAPSHAAVDSLLSKVKAAGCDGLARIGHPADVDKAHVRLTLQWLAREWDKSETLILSQAQAVFGTLTGCSTKVSSLPAQHFSISVLDEGGQALEANVWAIIPFTSKLVVAGDHLQLPPTVTSNSPKVKAALGLSLMERIVKEPKYNAIVRMLNVQYRMADPIMQWPNNTFYGGKLCAGPGVGHQSLAKLPGVKKDLLITTKQILLLDTAGKMKQKGRDSPIFKGSLHNPGESVAVGDVINNLIRSGVRSTQIGVITFYALQVDTIKQHLSSNNLSSIKVSSVDGFQGQEKEVIILSAVRSNNKGIIGFLKEERRLNVAITRAKKLLVVVADKRTLQSDNTFNSLFSHIKRVGEVIRL